jgi:hypothetical protein
MLNVLTLYLDSDARHAAVQHGTVKRGELDAAKIAELLENFMSIEAMEMVDVDPQVIIMSGERTLIIRTNRKKLFVYNAKDMNESAVEMTVAEILQRLGNVQPGVAPEEGAADQLQPGKAAVPFRDRTWVGYLLFVVVVLINVHTVYSNFFRKKHHYNSDITFFTDASAIAQQQRVLAGTYTTGSGPGSHVLVIGSDGTLKYSEIGAPGNPPSQIGPYHIGSRNQGLCLSVDGGRVIDVIDDNTLMYNGGTFHRVK